jgi:hypothetical protein
LAIEKPYYFHRPINIIIKLTLKQNSFEFTRQLGCKTNYTTATHAPVRFQLFLGWRKKSLGRVGVAAHFCFSAQHRGAYNVLVMQTGARAGVAVQYHRPLPPLSETRALSQ